jgi:hypothetical protein
MAIQLFESKQDLEDFKQSLRDTDPGMTEEEVDASVSSYVMFMGQYILDNPEDYGLI